MNHKTLIRLAEWLGEWYVCMPPRRDNGIDWPAYIARSDNTSEKMSDAELFCAIDDKCVVMDGRPKLSPYLNGRGYSFYTMNGLVLGEGATRLEAAVKAVITYLERS